MEDAMHRASNRLAHFRAALAVRLKRAREIRATRRGLALLDDHSLQAMGLARRPQAEVSRSFRLD
jgi:uncharacterized protein YjiS (DUF1127 family)